jgi:integrator complex subunit 1
MHVESITLIAAKIPTQTVVKQIFVHCLAGDTTTDEDAVMNPRQLHLDMLRSVCAVINSGLAAESLAAAVVDLTSLSPAQSYSNVIRTVVDNIGDQFDAFTFAECIVKSKMGVLTKFSTANECARLILECAVLTGGLKPDSKFGNKMLSLRKSILHWCVTDLGALYTRRISQEENARCNDSYDGNGRVAKGPAEFSFSSYLDSRSVDKNGPMYKYMTVVRSLLFLAPSIDLKAFDEEESECYKTCSKYPHIDDDMLDIILGSSSITHSTAVALVETLVFGCSSNVENDIPISSQAIWRLYGLAEYVPELYSEFRNDGLEFPRLAHTSLWWRVTAIALALCGLSSTVGKTMWNDHPTVRGLIKMTTSSKFRFPNADCDDATREIIRMDDRKAKEREAEVSEKLFTLPKQKKAFETKPVTKVQEHRQGLRSSARQREKRERVFVMEQERIADARRAEQIKIRRQLKMLAKSIMEWEPKQHQRKPPKESIDLILSVNDNFNLAERFRASNDPDYLLQTIGDGRSAIERAYDWLIPIISQDSAVISRLQSSSTCFLLLKAHGAGAEAKDLITLSAPLLSHVTKSLSGEYGEENSVLALKLLLMDIADESSDRRRCARKVLQQAIPNSFGLCGWLRQLIDCSYSKVLIPLSIEFLVRGFCFLF